MEAVLEDTDDLEVLDEIDFDIEEDSIFETISVTCELDMEESAEARDAGEEERGWEQLSVLFAGFPHEVNAMQVVKTSIGYTSKNLFLPFGRIDRLGFVSENK